jgi:hypothetical protein
MPPRDRSNRKLDFNAGDIRTAPNLQSRVLPQPPAKSRTSTLSQARLCRTADTLVCANGESINEDSMRADPHAARHSSTPPLPGTCDDSHTVARDRCAADECAPSLIVRRMNMESNDEVERRWVAPPTNEAALSAHRLPPWLTEDATPAIARTDC